ncbi:MAG TPA: M48 family metallopeptidase [Terriglobales bacterium]|nr:M48 family metallopeptidase [Terriglobales bacterium]
MNGRTMNVRQMVQRSVAIALICLMALPLQARYNAKPRWSLFSVEQEVQAGQQYSAEVEKQLPLVNDSTISSYVSRLGQRLAAKAPGTKYPYTFKVVNQKEINAFALPGGPIYVNLGTIQAASNESELAGVIAHEISHVVMRHSVNQASKQAAAQIPLAILGGRMGGGMAGQLAQLGIGFGVGSLFMKYSRDAEREADLVGADILYDAGYNPQGMVTFFRKLEGETGSRGSEFFQSHPNPGNRAEAVSKEIASLGNRQFSSSNNSEFQNIKGRVSGMKGLTAQEIAARQKQGGTGSTGTISRNGDINPSSTFKSLNHNAYTIQYPSNWEAYGDQSSTVTIAPKGGVSQDAVAYGVIISGFDAEQRNGNGSLDDAAHQLVQQVRQSNPDMKQVGNDEDFRLNGAAAKSIMMVGNSPLMDRNNRPERERDWMVVTKNRNGEVIYLVFIAPESDFQNLYPTYDKILRSARIK